MELKKLDTFGHGHPHPSPRASYLVICSMQPTAYCLHYIQGFFLSSILILSFRLPRDRIIMKIFDWVHGCCSFCNNKGRESANGNVGEGNSNEKAMWDHGWKERLILSIGTLLSRYEPLANDADDLVILQESELNKLSNYYLEFEGGGNINGGKFEYVMIEKRRTTLADLFSADNHEMHNSTSYWDDHLELELEEKRKKEKPHPHINKVEIIREKQVNTIKHRRRRPRKNLPAAEDRSRPIPKLHQLMRRLRWGGKIYPDSCKHSDKNNSEALLLHESS